MEKVGRLFSKILITLGAICILISFFGYFSIYLKDAKAYEEFKKTAPMFQDIIPKEEEIEEEVEKVEEVSQNNSVSTREITTSPLFVNSEVEENKEIHVDTIIINGLPYIGIININSVNISLPIHENWTDEKLDTSPCVYKGTLEGGDLIVGSHNAKSQFGPITRLDLGAEATISDANGKVYTYVLKEYMVISETEVRTLENIKNYELTLFTCDLDSSKRIVQRWSVV